MNIKFIFTLLSILGIAYAQNQTTTISSTELNKETAKKSALSKAIAEIKGVYVKTEFQSNVTASGDAVEKSASKSLSLMSLAYSVKISDEIIENRNDSVVYTATFTFDDPEAFKKKQIELYSNYLSEYSKVDNVFLKIENLYKAALIAQDMFYPVTIGESNISSPMDHVLKIQDNIVKDMTIVVKKFDLDKNKEVLFADMALYYKKDMVQSKKKALDTFNKRNYRLNRFKVLIDSVKNFDTDKFKKFRIRTNLNYEIKKSENEHLIFLNDFLKEDIKDKFEPLVEAKITLNIREFLANPDYFDQKNNEAEERVERKTYEPKFVKKAKWDMAGIIGMNKVEIADQLKRLNRQGYLRTKKKEFKVKKGRVNILYCFDKNDVLINVVVKLDFDNYADYYTGKYVYFSAEKYNSIIYTQCDF